VEKYSLDVPLFPVEEDTTTEIALSIFDVVLPTDPVAVLPKEILDEIRIVSVDEIELRDKDSIVEFNEKFEGLRDSVGRRGVLEPIAVEALPNGLYRISSGDQRLRAAQNAGLSRVKVRVIHSSDTALNSEISRLYELIESNIHRRNLPPLKLSEVILRIAILESGIGEVSIRAALNRESNAHRGSTRSTEDEQVLAALHRVLDQIGISQSTFRTEYLPLVDLEADLKIALQKNVPKSIVLELRKIDPDRREQIIAALIGAQKMPSVRTAREMIRGIAKTAIVETQFTEMGKKIDKYLQSLNGDYDFIYEVDFVFNALQLLVRSFEAKIPYDWHLARTYSPGPDDE
jgi:hypothetical protein